MKLLIHLHSIPIQASLLYNIIIPTIVRIPTIAKAIPVNLEIHIPFDHIFSTNIIPANRTIHVIFIHPNATINRK